MTKREIILERVRVAAYEDDTKTLTRLKIEGRISWAAFNEAVTIGRRQRRGNKCSPSVLSARSF
jgi:hypothetical protein